MDLNLITPAPLQARRAGSFTEHPTGRTVQTPAHVVRLGVDEQGRRTTTMVADFHRSDDDAEFYALARNWLDVQMRRRWNVRTMWSKSQTNRWLIADEADTPLPLPNNDSPLEAWQAAVDYDAELRAKEANVENTK